MQYLDQEFRDARRELTAFVYTQAVATARRVGYWWTGVADAPSTLEEMICWARLCAGGDGLFPVSNEACEGTIYLSSEANMAFRFWHDMLHLSMHKDVSYDDEMQVAAEHLRVAGASGLSNMAKAMLRADTYGQSMYYQAHGKFPEDQLAFVKKAIVSGGVVLW